MNHDNRKGKLRKIWNQNIKNQSSINQIDDIKVRKLSEININKYIKSLYVSPNWEPTSISFDAPLGENWNTVPVLPTVNWTANATLNNPVSYYLSPAQYQFDLLWYNWCSLDASVSTDKLASITPALPNAFANSTLQRTVASSVASGALSLSLSAQGFLTTDETPSGGTCFSTVSSAINYQYDVPVPGEKVYADTLIQAGGYFSSSISGTYNSSVRLQVRYEIRFTDSSTVYYMIYTSKNSNDSYLPYNAIEISDLTMSRNFATDIKNLLINHYGKSEAEVDGKLANGTYRIRNIFIRQDQTQTTQKFESGTATSSATLNWGVDYIRIITGSAIASFTYNLSSTEFVLPERYAPYVNIDVLSKLLDPDILPFHPSGDFDRLKTKILLIETEDIGGGYKKYKARAVGSFFKDISSLSEVTDYPQVKLIVNMINPKTYKQRNTYNFQ